MRISPLTKAILILVVILAVWIGGGIFIYYQTNPPSHTSPTTSLTTTTTTPATTTTTTTSNFSQGEQEYIDKIIDHSSRAINAITLLSNLLTDPQIDDATWVSQATTQINTIKALYDEISLISTPYEMFDIHYNYTYGISVYKSAAETIEQSISSQSLSQIQYAVSLINSGSSIISESIDMLNAFIAQRS